MINSQYEIIFYEKIRSFFLQLFGSTSSLPTIEPTQAIMNNPTSELLARFNISLFDTTPNPCLNLHPLKPLTVNNLDTMISRYVFPIQFVLGVLGNSVNLVVLLSAGMKNQVRVYKFKSLFRRLKFFNRILNLDSELGF
jgi:hypothetical protein